MSCWGSKIPNFSTRWEKGDVMYFTNIDHAGNHWLFGKLVLDQYVGSREEAEQIIGRSLTAADFNQYWIGEKPWLNLQEIPCRDLFMTLDFQSGKKLSEGYNGQALQSKRKLTEQDAVALEDLWLAYTE
jgi:hypothetical protein